VSVARYDANTIVHHGGKGISGIDRVTVILMQRLVSCPRNSMLFRGQDAKNSLREQGNSLRSL